MPWVIPFLGPHLLLALTLTFGSCLMCLFSKYLQDHLQAFTNWTTHGLLLTRWNYQKLWVSEVKVAQLCLALCDPIDYTVHEILQARILEWVAFPFSRGSSQPRDRTQLSCIAGRFFTSWAIREAHQKKKKKIFFWTHTNPIDPNSSLFLSHSPTSLSFRKQLTDLLPFNSVTQWCLTDPIDRSTPSLPAHHQLPEFTQSHVHWVGDAIQPSHPLLSPSLPAFKLSQHQGLFKWVSFSHQMAKYWSFSISPSNEYSGLISFRIDWLDLLAVQGTLKSLLQHHR